jgi:hypothetical protein
MPKVLVVLLGCCACLGYFLPAIGGEIYAVAGVMTGVSALLVVAYYMRGDHASTAVAAGVALIIGVLAGVFWPLALVTGVVLLYRRPKGAGLPKRPHVNIEARPSTHGEDVHAIQRAQADGDAFRRGAEASAARQDA